jgi:hypothetical protein
VDTVYGKRTGAAGAASVNGTSVLARMFAEAGFRVSSWERMSPRLKAYDVVVWAPDNFQPPTEAQRDFMEQWLREEHNRTLIYIGRDYDAAIAYWTKIRPEAPPGQVQEINRRLAAARVDYDARFSGMPKEQFCRWFTVRRDGARRKVKSLTGPFSRGIDASQVEIELRARFDVPTVEDVEQYAGGIDDGDEDDELTEAADEGEYSLLSEYLEPADFLPGEIDVLLASRNDPLVTRIKDPSFASESQILVVTNGSFLLNLPLVNHEHRKLAGRLIDACGQPGSVGFLESGPEGPPIFLDEPRAKYPTGLEALIVWPIGCMLMHLAVVGIVLCFALFPIFGRPRELPPESTSDFGKHIDALGHLLQRVGDPKYAADRVAQYQHSVRGETTGSRGVVRPKLERIKPVQEVEADTDAADK